MRGAQARPARAMRRLLPLGRARLLAAAVLGPGAPGGLVPPLRTATAGDVIKSHSLVQDFGPAVPGFSLGISEISVGANRLEPSGTG